MIRIKKSDWSLIVRPVSVLCCLYFISGVIADAQVCISSPSAGATFSNPQIVAIKATLTTNAARVGFYNGKVEKAVVTNSVANTFAYDWVMTSADNGTNVWTAIALDSAGQNAWTSSVVSVAVKIPNSLPPTILVQPRNRKVVIGRLASFGVTADGATPLAYQWFYNGTALPAGTAATLKLAGVTTNIAGAYSVTVSNAYGVASSSPATLKVIKPLLPPTGLRIVH